MGSATARMAGQTQQDRDRHPDTSNGGNSRLDFADSAPVVHRMERGAEESSTNERGQPYTRECQASGGQPAEEHSQGRRCTSVSEPKATPTIHASRSSGDALNPDHPSTGSRSLPRPGLASQQLRRKGHRTSPTQGKGQQDSLGQGAGKATTLSDKWDPLHKPGNHSEQLREERPPHPSDSKGNNDTVQRSITAFFRGRSSADEQISATPKTQDKITSTEQVKSNHRDSHHSSRASNHSGTHQTDGKDDSRRDKRTPHLPDKVHQPDGKAASRGQRKDSSLLSWRIMGTSSREPNARALAFANPHSLCYANAVLRMLHQARSLEGPITGLGEMNGPLMQAARSNRMVNIARDPAWTFIWPGWQRPTRQHDAAEFLQHLCQKTECATLRGGWEERRHRGGAYEVMGEQFTCPHVRLPMQRPFQIQEAVQQWHNQDATHAFTHPPILLILQVSRFLHTDRGIRKTRQTFQLQREINIPTFSDHKGNIEQTPYILSGGVLHVGQVVTAGHYQAFYFPGDSVDPWPTHMIHDDGQTAQPGNDATRQAIHTNCYLLAYTRV